MNKQRKVVITTTYNEMGIIIDTKAEEVAQPDLQPTCNQLATDCIKRQAAINAAIDAVDDWDGGYNLTRADMIEKAINALPSAEPNQTVSNIIESLPTSPLLVGKMPSVQPESTANAEFWRKRADYYSDMCSKLIADMGAGVKIEAVKIDETGITFTKKKPPEQQIDLQEIEDRFGKYVRFVVNDMLTGEGKRWTR